MSNEKMDRLPNTPDSPQFREHLHTLAETMRKETERDVAAEQEKIRSELRKIYEEGNASAQSGTTATTAHTEYDEYMESIDTQYREQVSALIDRAVQSGIVPAIRKAQKKNDPYLMDLFHDALVLYYHKQIRDSNLL